MASTYHAGKRLNRSVVQRIQRFGQGSIFKRTVLQSIAAELLTQGKEVPCRRSDDEDENLQDTSVVDATASGGERSQMLTC